ncbi:hypothetical protein Syun_013413 [Stephania yunnanensis]|uniref:Pectinesterase n=1 Tax=Stephania yunnanensis TaxID=152371 RepID=A0AAP0K1B3_9MAGN
MALLVLQNFLLLLLLSLLLFINTIHALSSSSSSTDSTHAQTLITNTCIHTQHPNLCSNSLLPFSHSLATRADLVHVSFNVTLHRAGKAFMGASAIANTAMDSRVRSAYSACLELLEDSLDLLARSIASVSNAAAREDVTTWLSAAMTNSDTCVEGFDGLKGFVRDHIDDQLTNLSELVSNCLAIYTVSGPNVKDFSGVPIQNKRRRLLFSDIHGGSDHGHESSSSSSGVEYFPRWLRRRERRLLQLPVSVIRPDIVVSQDGNGTYRTIREAIKAAPQQSDRKTIIYVKAGRYEESNLKVGRKKTNLMFIGDGKGKTIISGGKSVFDNLTTFHTAAFGNIQTESHQSCCTTPPASGSGFIARDMTFVNWAGPYKHQAVALRVGADHAVVYRCSIIGYQDTLYVHSQRQFFRECDIYGTVDFIFGNAAVVLQNCSLYARKPMDFQKNTITAQNRKDPNQNTGISIHACRILAAPDLQVAKGNFSTYLGRPWKLYSRTVLMQSYIGDHVHPRGWLEWNATFALDTLYYGEYMNYGPGSALGQRVKWPGYRVITGLVEASKFTVSQFIFGTSWLPSTGVTFLAGLSV